MTEGSAETLQLIPYITLITAPAWTQPCLCLPGREQVGWAAWLSFGTEPGKHSHREMRLAGRRDVTSRVRSTPEALQV